MNEIRVGSAPGGWRDEVFSFDGASALQRRILDAHAAGDEALLATLRAEFRSRAHGITRTQSISMPPSESSITTPTRSTFAVERSLVGYAVTWSATPPCRIDHGAPPHLLAFVPTSVDRWLSALDPGDELLGVFWRHGHDERAAELLGHVVAFAVDDIGLKTTVELKGEDGFQHLLDAGHRGQLAFSINARVQVSSQERRDGQDITVATAAGLNEVSLLLRSDAGDPNAIVLEVAGVEARYRSVEAARERDRMLKRLYGFERSRQPWRSPGVRPRSWGR